MVDSVIQDRIAKLLAKAKGTANEHEAAIFAAKAAEMLAEHNLTEAMIAARQSGNESPVGEHPFATRAPDVWRLRILQGCAKLYFCSLLHYSGDKARANVFVGREHNAVVAAAMAEYLMATVKRMAREYSTYRTEQHDFRRGAGDRLYERLYRLWEEQNKPAVSASNPNNLYNHEQLAVRSYLDNLKVHTAKARGHSYKGAGAYAGRDAADRISLAKQVAERRADRMLGSR